MRIMILPDALKIFLRIAITSPGCVISNKIYELYKNPTEIDINELEKLVPEGGATALKIFALENKKEDITLEDVIEIFSGKQHINYVYDLLVNQKNIVFPILEKRGMKIKNNWRDYFFAHTLTPVEIDNTKEIAAVYNNRIKITNLQKPEEMKLYKNQKVLTHFSYVICEINEHSYSKILNKQFTYDEWKFVNEISAIDYNNFCGLNLNELIKNKRNNFSV